MPRTLAGARTASGNRFLVRDFGTSLFFNGSTAYVGQSAAGVFATTGYSVEFWFKANNTNNGGRLYSEGSSSAGFPNFGLSLNASGGGFMIALTIVNGANTSLLASNGLIVTTPGRWHHAVWTDNNGTCALYIDNVLDGRNFNYTPSGTFTMNQTAIATRWRNGTGNFFQGYMDIVRTYNVALTATNVSQLYYQGIVPDRTKLHLEWLLDDNTGTTASDTSGNGNNGTLTGSTLPTWSTEVFMKNRTSAGARTLVT